MLQDLRQAARSFFQRPGFTAVVLLTLALGIGAGTAIFSVVSHVLLRPLPYPEPERLVQIWTRFPQVRSDRFPLGHAEYWDYRAESTLYDEVAAYAERPAVLTGAGEPLRLISGHVTASLWPVLGRRPHLGRTFGEEEEEEDAPVVVLSHGLWQRRFGGEPEIVGRTIQLDGIPRTVIGVMPAGFRFPYPEIELWVPLMLLKERRDNHHLRALGRLADDATLEQVLGEMEVISARWQEQYEHAHPFNAVTYEEELLGDVEDPLRLIFAAVGFVLVIACVNVAGLLLARGESRHRELGVRAALGAGRRRIVRQLLTESVLLGVVGGALGVLVALAGLEALLALEPGNLPRIEEVRIDVGVLIFSLAVSVVTGIVFGLVPAWRASRPNLISALHDTAARSTAGAARQGLRSVLVVAEIAVAMLLVVGAGLVLRSFWNLHHVDPGLDSSRVLAARVSLPATAYPESHDVNAFYREAVERIRALPGVRSASVVNTLPLRDGIRMVLLAGPWLPPDEDPVGVDVTMVGAEYFRTLGVPVVRGRRLTAADREDAPRVAALNQTLARMLFGDEEALGRQITILQSQPREPAWEVVAVVRDVPTVGLAQEVRPQIFVPMPQAVTQIRGVTRTASLVVKTEVDPIGLAGLVRSEIWEIDGQLAVSDLQSMESVLSASLVPQRFTTTLLAVFSGLALVLAAVGIYGLLAHVVGLRRREFGIRLALGARPEQLLRLVLGRGLLLAGLGVVLGLLGGLAASFVLESFLYGVGNHDPLSFASTAVLLAAAAALACWVPARRAARADPAVTLREE
ncbi:MAG: ABC transporter permease [bacterium]|nr:ABC transporter permease [bacterium]